MLVQRAHWKSIYAKFPDKTIKQSSSKENSSNNFKNLYNSRKIKGLSVKIFAHKNHTKNRDQFKLHLTRVITGLSQRLSAWLSKQMGVLPWVMALLYAGLALPSYAITPFANTYAANLKGDVAAIGNTNATCQGRNATQITNCASAQANTNYSGGTLANNNDWQTASDANRLWQYVNVDAVAATSGFRDSSMAELKLPAGAVVRDAQLYWNFATPASAGPSTVSAQFRHGGAVAYTAVNSDTLDYYQGASQRLYAARANVTALVQATGSGNYYVAGLSSNDNGYTGVGPDAGPASGWALVVTFEHSSLPLRNLSVYSGFQGVAAATNPVLVPAIALPLTNLRTPLSGTVNAKVGWVALDGDRAGADGNLNFAPMPGSGICDPNMAGWVSVPSNAMNPSNNIGNSTISYLGAQGGYDNGALTPSYNNTLGLDIDTFSANDFLGAGATNGIQAACVRLGSVSTDGVFPLALFTVTDIFVPEVSGAGAKSQANLTHPALVNQAYPGDVIEYTIHLTNTGLDAATHLVLTDTIPVGTRFVPGSLRITNGANPGTKTDAVADDQAEFSAGQVTFRLGQGATASTGGTLGEAGSTTVSPSTTLRFQVRVDANTSGPVTNKADLTFEGATTGIAYNIETNSVSTQVLVPVMVLSVQTNGAAGGPFGFGLSGTDHTHGVASTTAANTPEQVDADTAVAGLQPYTVTPGVPLVIDQNSLPAGWTLTSASCTRDGVPVGSLAGGVYTVTATEVYGANFACLFINTAPGSLNISKLIQGSTPATLASLNGLIKLSIDCGSGFHTTASLAVTNGVPAAATVPNVPAGLTCKVAETSVPNAPPGMEWDVANVTYSGSPATIVPASAAQVRITNILRAKTPIIISVPATSWPALVVLALCVLTGGILYVGAPSASRKIER